MSTRTASRVKAHLAEVIEAARESGEAITITKNGEGTAVLQGDLASYEAMRRSLAMLKVVAQSERDLARGRSISQHRVFRGLRKRLAAR
jgi:prevent-host-death family protein